MLQQQSKCFSPPNAISFNPRFCHYEKQKFVSGGSSAAENITAIFRSKRGVGSETYGRYPCLSEREVVEEMVEVEKANKNPCFFDGGATAGKIPDSAVAVDEAIAWAKEKFSNRVAGGLKETKV